MKRRTPFIISLIIVLILVFGIFYYATESFDFLTEGLFYVVSLLMALFTLLVSYIGKLMDIEKFSKLSEHEKEKYIASQKKNYFSVVWDNAVRKSTTEDNGGIAVLDHGYDGIVELDNQLPRWWVMLFYFGVIYMVVYMISYISSDFAHSDIEFEQEMVVYKKDSIAYDKLIPQATLETAIYNESEVVEGQAIFEKNCVTCHGQGAVGGSGPNLLDDYWLNKPEPTLFKNIYHTVWSGSENGMMAAFGENGDLRGNDVQKVSSYLAYENMKSEKNEDGSAKQGVAKQGEKVVWLEGGAETPVTEEATTEKVQP